MRRRCACVLEPGSSAAGATLERAAVRLGASGGVDVEFGILGPLTLSEGGKPIVVGAAKPRALLVRLLLDANRTVPAERLVDDVWEGDPPRSASQTLQTYVSQLRKALGADRVASEAGGYGVVVGPDELDAGRFESLVSHGRDVLARGDPAAAARVLGEALALWRGAALADAAGAMWAAAESARLEELRLVATEARLEAQLALGDHRTVVVSAESAVTEHPLRERLWALLMLALYRDGRQGDALRAFQRLRRHLGEELGIEPSAELQQLEARMLRQEPALGPPSAPTGPLVSLPTGVVTFVLTDVAGSTRLWEEAPDEMAAAVLRHEELLRAAVTDHHGVLLKSRGEGDSTFSVFRRATDAVAAAVDAQTALAAEPWPTPHPIRVRIAVHSGEAIERDGDYYGRSVNRAARLRAATMPDQILVSQAAAELAADDLPDGYRLHTLGVQELRDLERPETVFVLAPLGEVVTPPPTASSTSAARVPLPLRLTAEPTMGFVGRAAEADRLENAYKEVAAGRGRLVLIAGEPGIGKTSLAARLARAAFDRGATVLFGRCDEDLGVPYRPWVEALEHLVVHADRAALEAVGPRAASDLARLVPAVTDRVPAATPSRAGDADADRWSVYAAVVALLRACATHHPLVLVIDDLQWADKPTLLLLRHIVDAIPSSPVLVVGTYRDRELAADHPASEAIGALRRDPSTERVALGGLADDEVVSLVESASGRPLARDGLALVHAVRRETDGNPFFVEALLRHLAETGAVYIDDEGRWQPRAELDEAGLPDSVREVVGQRVARLGDNAKHVLTTAAVIGQEFDLDTLAGALTERADSVLDAIEAAEAAGLVTTVSAGRFAFAHALVATTLLTGLTATRRARMHRDIAEAIETLHGADARVGELARHWAAATAPSDRAKAIEYASRAGDSAMHALAPDEAVRWYRQALDMLGPPATGDEARRAELLVFLGRAERNAGDPAFRRTLLDAARLARQIGDGPLLARAALANSRGWVTHLDEEIEDRVEMLEAALDLIAPNDSVARARLLAALGAELVVSGHHQRRWGLTDQALAMARRLGHPALLASVINNAAFAIWEPSTLPDRLNLTAEAVRIAETLDDRALLHWSAQWRVHALVESGDVDEAAHWLDVMARVATETGQPNLQRVHRMFRGALALLHGDTAEALRLGGDAVAHASASNTTEVRDMDTSTQAMVAWQGGHLLEDLPRLQSAYPLPGWTGVTVAEVLAGAAHDLVSIEFRTEGSRLILCLDWPENQAIRESGHVGWIGLAVVWALASGGQRSPDHLRIVYEALEPYHDQVATAGSHWPGPVAGALALIAAELDRIEDAVRFFQEADEINHRIRAPFFLAINRLGWARALLRRGEPGDNERAVDLAASALAVAREHDFTDVVRGAEALLATPPTLPTRLSAALPPRLVGRAGELAQLADAIRAGGSTVLIAGEPGIGKSSLVAAAADEARDNGAWVLYGRCDEDLRVPFLPFLEAMTHLLASVPDDTLDRIGDRHLAELVRIVPALTDRRPSLPPPQATDPETERYLFMNAVVATFVEASRRAPLVYVVDDLHWADKPSMLLLRHLLHAVPGSAITVLGTYRQTDLLGDTPLAEVLPQLRNESTVRHLALSGLDVAEVASLTGAGPQMAGALHRETDGNPFFVTELFRQVSETGADAAAVPQALRGVVLRRLARLGDDVRSTLTAASAIGREFELSLLAATLGWDGDALLDPLERAEAAALVVTVAPERYAFAHALIQHAIYDELPPTRRARVHRQIATALDQPGLRDTRVTELARHWTYAAVTPEDVAIAVEHVTRAAEHALEALAPNEAVRWFEEALGLLAHQPTSDDRLRCRLLVGLTEAQLRIGDSLFRRTRMQAAELALRIDDTDLLVAAVLKDYQEVFTVPRDPAFIGMIEEALRRVGDGDTVERALLLSRYGACFLFSDPGRQEKLFRQAVAVARRVGDLPTLAKAMTQLGSGSFLEAFENQDVEALALAQKVGDPHAIFNATYYAQWRSLQMRGEPVRLWDTDADLLEDWADRLRAMAEELGRPDTRFVALGVESTVKLVRGDLATAEQLSDRARELGRELRQEHWAVIHAALLQSIRWHQGRQAEMVDLVAAASEEEPDMVILRLPVTLSGSSVADDLVDVVRNLPMDSAWLVGASILADIIGRRDDAAAGALLYDQLLPHAGKLAWAAPMVRDPIDHSLGQLARSCGRTADALRHFSAAEELEQRLRFPFFLARTRLEMAAILDDRAHARTMLESVLALAQEHGYSQVERRAARALAQLA